MDRRSFLQISAVTTVAIGFSRSAFVAAVGNGALLDIAEAVRFHEKNPPELGCASCDLDVYKRATPDALEYLANQGYNEFVYLGLAELDKNTARILARWDSALIFSNLKHLDTETAAILSDSTNIRAFNKLMISPEVAKELAWVNGILDLKMDSISVEVANELVRHPHELYLHTQMPPSEQVLHILCSHAGYRLRIGGWAYQPGNQIRSFEPPNGVKIVYFDHHQQFDCDQNKYDGEWFESVHIDEDIHRWHAERYLPSFDAGAKRCPVLA